MESFTEVNAIKVKAKGNPVLILPLIIYSDDLSGNRTKKWNKFDCITFLLAGLSKEMNTDRNNIHLICTSNKVTALEMLRPIVDELKILEDGVFLYDAHWKEEVYVIAPVFMLICDNPRASEFLGHMTGNPKKFCHFCLVIIIMIKLLCMIGFSYT